MIYRRFMRPCQLLEMLVARFDALGEFDEEETNFTRQRICHCLYLWLKEHPNDILHRHTRQLVAAFLRDRVEHFPYLKDYHKKLLPMSSISYFDSWRYRPVEAINSMQTLNSRASSRSSSVSGAFPFFSAAVSVVSDDDSEPSYHDSNGVMSEDEMDEDREWGMVDEDDILPESTLSASSPSSRASSANLDSISEFAQLISSTGGTVGSRPTSKVLMPSHLPARDRRSSTGSFAQASPCAMETFVAGRRGSASSVSSNPGPFSLAALAVLQQQPGVQQNAPAGSFVEGEMPSLLQPISAIPFINKRSSSQAYRQQRAMLLHQQNATTPPPPPSPGSASQSTSPTQSTVSMYSGPVSALGSFSSPATPSSTPVVSSEIVIPGSIAAAVSKAASIFKESVTVEDKVHPFSQQGKSNNPHYSNPITLVGGLVGDTTSMTYSTLMELRDVTIAEQLTCIAHNLFKRMKPKYRARVMEKFISVAKISRDMGNYNTVMAIIGALSNSSIHRLTQTREILQGKEIWNTYKELEQLMSPERSFYEYRAALRSTRSPCIPYLGIHLQDLLSISEGNKDTRQDGTLHWQKFALMADVVSIVISVFQQDSSFYKIFQQDPSITKLILETRGVMDDDEQYSRSTSIEPSSKQSSKPLNHSRSLSKLLLF
ncbi:hypothetical protein BGZ76_005792 [Entomortierella beljakovae]|nr:hypothetical protein BGZ76_005792 [Entomortierella beljakovae]